MAAESPSTAGPSGRPSPSPYRNPRLASPQQRAQPSSSYGPSQVLQFEASPQYEDVWVTVYGFTQVRMRVNTLSAVMCLHVHTRACWMLRLLAVKHVCTSVCTCVCGLYLQYCCSVDVWSSSALMCTSTHTLCFDCKLLVAKPLLQRASEGTVHGAGCRSRVCRSSATPRLIMHQTILLLIAAQHSFVHQIILLVIMHCSQPEVPLILKEFSKCGDILQWGTYGQPQSNFLHIQV